MATRHEPGKEGLSVVDSLSGDEDLFEVFGSLVVELLDGEWLWRLCADLREEPLNFGGGELDLDAFSLTFEIGANEEVLIVILPELPIVLHENLEMAE